MEGKLIKATVLSDFFDKDSRGVLLRKGDIIERSETRIKELQQKKLVNLEVASEVVKEVVEIKEQPKGKKKQ